MDKVREIENLVNKYLHEIEVEDADFIIYDNAVSDASSILLNLPISFLKAYLLIKDQDKQLPDIAEFWKDTSLVSRLNDIDKNKVRAHFLSDVLDYMHGRVCGMYQEISNSGRIRMRITEIPQMIKD